MAKKIDDTEVKKECPSCGLGVALDSTICEFCGWDFEEEDEWILQIERLERDLILEKQKFAPGTMDSKIESTIHSPAAARAEMLKASQQEKKSPDVEAGPQPRFSPSPSTKAVPQQVPVAAPQKVRVVREAEGTEPAKRYSPPPQSETSKAPERGGEMKAVRTVKSPTPAQEPRISEPAPELTAQPTKKTRILRKVKK